MATASDMKRLEKKLDELLEISHNTDKEVVAVAIRVGQIENHLKVQNGRIGQNERWRIMLTGGGVVLLAIVAYIGNIIIKLLPGG